MHIVRKNIDNEENLRVLVSYQECLLNKFKACEKGAAQIHESFKEQLLEELSVWYVDVMDKVTSFAWGPIGFIKTFSLNFYPLFSLK